MYMLRKCQNTVEQGLSLKCNNISISMKHPNRQIQRDKADQQLAGTENEGGEGPLSGCRVSVWGMKMVWNSIVEMAVQHWEH